MNCSDISRSPANRYPVCLDGPGFVAPGLLPSGEVDKLVIGAKIAANNGATQVIVCETRETEAQFKGLVEHNGIQNTVVRGL